MEYGWDEREASALPDDLDRMAYLSRRIGGDPLLIQPGGGNTSIKWTEKDPAGREVRALRVKASGADLATMGRGGFTGLRLSDLRVLRDRDTMTDEEMLSLRDASRLDPDGPAPSLETPLHALLPHRCIAHVHDLWSLALTDTSRRDALAREALGEEAACVGYVRPGFPLARTVRALGDLGKARGLVMGKHGIAAWGETPKECYDNLHRLIGRAREYVEKACAGKKPYDRHRHPEPGVPERRARAAGILPLLRGALSKEHKVVLCYDGSDEAAAFASSQRAKDVHRRGMATPEHIFRCGRAPLYVDAPLGALPAREAEGAALEAIDRFEAEYRASFAKHNKGVPMHDPRPRILILPGLGVVAAGKGPREAEVAGLCYRHVIRVMGLAEMLDQFRFLEEASSFELEYWPWERIRPPKPEGPLSRRVALVSEDPPGLGKALAERFGGAGGHVTRARFADEEASARAVEAGVLQYGGIDIVVCDAAEEARVRPSAVRVMEAQGDGTILLTSSEAAAKPALTRLIQGLAAELAPRRIRVHGLHLGAVGIADRDAAAAEAALSLAVGTDHVSGSVVTAGAAPR